MVLEQVAFDIETTGFNSDDVVTTVGFAMPMGVKVFAQTDGRPSGDVAVSVDEATERLVTVSMHPSEQELLTAVSEFVAERFCGSDVLLVAYNGERWNGGFDLPFLRTRYAQQDMPWPFVDVPYADVMPLVTDRFNTTVEGEEHAGLVAAYEVMCDGALTELDPFAESQEAVAAFREGRFDEVVLHNAADVLRTSAVGRVAERYCAKSEFSVKSMTPIRGA